MVGGRVRYASQQTDRAWTAMFRNVFTQGRTWKVRTLYLRSGMKSVGSSRMYNRKRSVILAWKRHAFRSYTAWEAHPQFPGYQVIGMGVDDV